MAALTLNETVEATIVEAILTDCVALATLFVRSSRRFHVFLALQWTLVWRLQFPSLLSSPPPPANTPQRRNEAACKWRLIPSIKVNEVGAQLTQSSPWLRRHSSARFDINAGYSLFLFLFSSFFFKLCHIMRLFYLPGASTEGKKGLSASSSCLDQLWCQ